jgi:hypothetical protein
VDYLKFTGADMTVDCLDVTRDKKTGRVTTKHFGKRTATLKIALATSLTRRTPEQQREYEDAIRTQRREAFHAAAREQREAERAIKRAEKEWKDSFKALPGASVVAPVTHVGPTLRDQLLGLAERRAAPSVPRPTDAPQGWVNGVVYDVLSVNAMLPHHTPEPEPESDFDGITYLPTADRPIRVETIESGWSHVYYISVEEATHRLEEQEAAAKAKSAAVSKAQARVAARAMVAMAPVGGKKGVLAGFFKKA